MDTVLVDRCNVMTFIATVGEFSRESWFLYDGDSGETPSLFKLIEILAFLPLLTAVSFYQRFSCVYRGHRKVSCKREPTNAKRDDKKKMKDERG